MADAEPRPTWREVREFVLGVAIFLVGGSLLGASLLASSLGAPSFGIPMALGILAMVIGLLLAVSPSRG